MIPVIAVLAVFCLAAWILSTRGKKPVLEPIDLAEKATPKVLGEIEVELVPEDVDDADPEVRLALGRFLALGEKDRAALEQRILEYRSNTLRLSPEIQVAKIASPEEVWSVVEIRGVGLTKDGPNGSVYVRVFGECDWEPEHGLQICYRNGSELARVGPEDGHLI